MKLADLMIEKSRSVRSIFTKYSVPEVFPDRQVLELLSPPAFIEGLKETGISALEDFEVACLMRVLAKPELDNSIILNEFVMIMENFGVMDQPDAEEFDDYISDTEASQVSLAIDNDTMPDDKEANKEPKEDKEEQKNPKEQKDKTKEKRKPR